MDEHEKMIAKNYYVNNSIKHSYLNNDQLFDSKSNNFYEVDKESPLSEWVNHYTSIATPKLSAKTEYSTGNHNQKNHYKKSTHYRKKTEIQSDDNFTNLEFINNEAN